MRKPRRRGAGHAEPATAAPTAGYFGATSTITLITGDRVRVQETPDGRSGVTVLPAPGREDLSFHQIADDGELSVIPTDAWPLVRQGRLDARLFDIPGLIEQGFGDAGPPSLIVSYRDDVERPLEAAFPASTAQIGRELPSVNGVVVEPPDDAVEFWSTLTNPNTTLDAGVDRIWLNGRARMLDAESNDQIGAPTAWAAGFTGEGATVAVLDSGYDPDHPDLAEVVVGAQDFTDSAGGVRDVNGHGTHVASTVAGSGAASDGAQRGVAPSAKILAGKVCDDTGACPDDAIIAGMEWAAEQGVAVVNLSLGSEPTDGTDPLSTAVNRLTESTGTLFVVAAGNFGGPETVSAPAAADAALAVASVTKDDELSYFSSRGPRAGDQAIKPDLAAPGSDIVGARAGHGGEPYTTMSGTSMAAPHVAGAAALLAARHPDWTQADLTSALLGSAKTITGLSVAEQGGGRLDVAAAVRSQVRAHPASVDLGRLAFPAEPDPVAQTLTYRNDGEQELVLDLVLDAVDETGQPLPADVFTLDADQITVPAGGAAGVEVAIDPSAGDQTGFLSGSITATAIGDGDGDGDTTVTTAVGAFVEPESYDLSIEAVTHSGTVDDDPLVFVINRDTGEPVQASTGPDGSAVARVPVGRYHVLSHLSEYTIEDGEITSENLTTAAAPDVLVTADAHITLDGTLGEPLRAQTERETVFDSAIMRISTDTFELSAGAGPETAVYAVPTGEVDGLGFAVKPTLRAPEGTEEDYRYHLVFDHDRGIPDSLVFPVSDADLAQVRAEYRGQGVAASAYKEATGILPSDLVPGGILRPLAVPGTRLELFTAAGVEWRENLNLGDRIDTDEDYIRTTRHEPGRSETSWNRAPLGVSIGSAALPGAVRVDDMIFIQIGAFAPADEESDYVHLSTSLITGSTMLSRDGTVLGTSPEVGSAQFDVPQAEGDYTLEVTGTREVPWSTLGRRVDASWSFSTDTPQGGEEALPLLAVRFDGEFDELGRTQAGIEQELELRVDRLHEAEISELSVEASYDDGATWEPVSVDDVDGGRRVALDHPAEDGFVSLRAAAVDADGNSVEQTMIRAFEIVLD
ncbi:S8 family peptidase [Actinoalloteichus sp. GBA129-24]|uniref:S8 family peptidase n=1 Tax=Actinoalloteichus sp. GBA129-24 TaxID=1612551 RepID=UPI000950948A|nr:S8 family serine peptidase [Actinoalloteichus sp. GBA129-24]APU22193.1 subtilisin-like serine protease [Actinoalloteichus sp. GBA129-24]